MILISYGKPMPAKIRLTSSGKIKRLQWTRQERRRGGIGIPDGIEEKIKSIRNYHIKRLFDEFEKTAAGAGLLEREKMAKERLDEIIGNYPQLSLSLADAQTRMQIIDCYKYILRSRNTLLSFCKAQEFDEKTRTLKPKNAVYKSFLNWLDNSIKNLESGLERMRASL